MSIIKSQYFGIWRFFLRDRLKELLECLGVSQAEFAREVGLSKNQLGEVLAGRAKSISTPTAALIHERYGVSLEWLLVGKGDMFGGSGSSNPATNLTEDSGAEQPLREGQVIPPSNPEETTTIPGGVPVATLPTIVLRFYPGGIPAGPLDTTDDHFELVQVTLTPPIRKGCIMIRVRGESMLGAGILDGDIVVLDTNIREPMDGDIVIVTVDGGSTMKYWFRRDRRVYLAPHSDHHDPIDITDRDVVLDGVVVEVRRTYQRAAAYRNGGSDRVEKNGVKNES